ncbi:hypothetical protein B0H13DRAFT_1889659 [Mycena leptocephala]|nr:hypothetical protein B0H13DRAFT_1889659 [Mycena leptocephala]
MPRQPSVTEIRLENIKACLAPAVTLLNELNDAFGPSFVQPISNTVQSLISAVQNVKQNKNECAQLLENIHQVLYAIVNLHIKSETAGTLPPTTLTHIGSFMETLHKIYTFVEAQQEGNKLKQLFRSSEMNTLLKDCHAGLDQAMEVFSINTSAIFNDINEMRTAADIMHKELLELTLTMSDTSTISDKSATQLYLEANDSKNSSNSFSMLPSKPKIFHGREAELEDIMKILAQESPRVAILGAGGMGKTSLARAVLHHPDTSTQFEHRFFVSAESATTSVELVALIGLHVGLKPGINLTQPVVKFFSKMSSCLLILDNLETPWEPVQTRGGVEEFLSLLTDIQQLALIITMRGAERPAKVRWTHPFLLPLKPLSDNAARQTFIDITDESHETEEMNKLLQITDNMPLAVDLMAHMADYEGCSTTLTRWEAEKTSLLSTGYDRKSNLDVSISLSLSSPRITSNSKDLLSLLSILPDGLADAELIQSNLPIPDILGSKATLLATSLAYQDEKKRLRSLMPVREHIQQFLPPSQPLVRALRKHFYSLLELYQKYNGEQLRPVVNQITLNLGNLQDVLRRGLQAGDPNLVDTMYCTFSLNSFYRLTRQIHSTLMDYISPILPQPCDHRLETSFLREQLMFYTPHAEELLTQAQSHFQHLNDPALELRFYTIAGNYFTYYELDPPQAMKFLDKALELSMVGGNPNQQCRVLVGIALFHWRVGDFCLSQMHAIEAQQLSRLSANLFDEAVALQIDAMCSMDLGNYQESMTQLYRARELLHICGMSGAAVDHNIRTCQAEVHLLKSEYGKARSINIQIIETTSDENPQFHAIALLNIAEIDEKIGRAAKDVYQNLDKANEIFSDFNDQISIINCEVVQAAMHLREEKFALAKVKLQQCFRSAWGRNNQAVSYCLETLANIKAWQAIGPQFRWPVVYLAYAHKTKVKLALHKALLFMGDVFIFNEDEDTAYTLYVVALEGFTYMDVHHSRAQCMLCLGDIAEKRTDFSKATEYWNAARPLFERSLQEKDVAKIDKRLAAMEETEKALVQLKTLCAPTTLPEMLLNSDNSKIQELEERAEQAPQS